MNRHAVPQVSIVMPCHNGELTLQHAINSVIQQTLPDWELLVVNDASTDRTAELLSEFATQDARIRVFTSSKSSGAAGARNLALQQSQGRYIAFLDCDDVWLPAKLDTQLTAMRLHKAALACSAYEVIDADGITIGRVDPKPGVLTYRGILGNNPVGCLTAVLDRTLCGEIRFNPALQKGEDYFLWLSILKTGVTGICLKDTLALYRVHGNTLSSNKFSAAWNRWRVYREFEKHNILRSGFYFAIYACSGLFKMLLMRRHLGQRNQEG